MGGAGNDTINGGLGSDEMTGGVGIDFFVFNDLTAGNVDVITDFDAAAETLRLSGVDGQGQAGKFAALSLTDTGAGVEVGYDGWSLLLEGVSAADLDQGNFPFL